MNGKLLKALLDNEEGRPFLTVKQRQILMKKLSRERIPITITVSGGEFLHLIDLAGSVEQIDPFLGDAIRQLFSGLGNPYEIPIPPGEEPPPLGKRPAGKLRRAMREDEKDEIA